MSASYSLMTRRTALVAGLLALGAAGAACGSAAAPSPPTGVDRLVIPTPEPDPADFTAVVDNVWLPLPVGERWSYTRTDGSVVEVRVEAGPTIAGVATTSLVGPDGAVDHFAEDDDGNVWWFGRGDDSFAAPGLAMPAEPRRGDGFAMAPELGLRALVAGVDGDRADPDTVVLDVIDADGRVDRRVYERGVGLVRTGELTLQESPAGR